MPAALAGVCLRSPDGLRVSESTDVLPLVVLVRLGARSVPDGESDGWGEGVQAVMAVCEFERTSLSRSGTASPAASPPSPPTSAGERVTVLGASLEREDDGSVTAAAAEEDEEGGGLIQRGKAGESTTSLQAVQGDSDFVAPDPATLWRVVVRSEVFAVLPNCSVELSDLFGVPHAIKQELDHVYAHAVGPRSASGAIPASLQAPPTDDQDEVCVVCLTLPRTIALLPCRHCCLCPSCSERVEHCPVCRADIRALVHFNQ